MLLDSTVLEPGRGKRHFDLLINCVGYEERARYPVASGIVSADNYISFVFEESGLFGYDQNLRMAGELGSKLIKREELVADRAVIDHVLHSIFDNKRLRVGIDISCMNRSMIAAAFRAVLLNPECVEAATIIYTPAKYRAPDDRYPQIDQIGPVIPELSGYQSDPSLPIGLLIGLGYEFGIASGIMNRLEPKLTIAFRAVGNGQPYEEAVRKANFDFAFGMSRCEVTNYSLLQPHLASAYIENILFSMARQYRCILVPMGPKLLSAIFILAGFHFFGRIAVWRISEIGKEAHNATPDGKLVMSDIDLARTLEPVSLDRIKALHRGSIV